jgi:hypothetical protein
MFRIYMKEGPGRWQSGDYRGVFNTVDEARARFKEGPKNPDGSPFPHGCGLPAENYFIQDQDDLDGPRHSVTALTRAERQRLRRASPEAKAKEAKASRASYWRKKFYAAPIGTQGKRAALQRLHQETGG